MEVVVHKFEDYDFLFRLDRNLLPNEDDNSTLFMCSGMQRFKKRFVDQDGGRLSSLQSCLRTDDLELVGDGSHLSYFEMLGNFSFGNGDYEKSIDLWCEIVKEFDIKIDSVHVHPSQELHKTQWSSRGFNIVLDDSCVWTAESIGGFCCELYVGDLEIGNLVNTSVTSTDVGFGFERLHQVIERKSRVDETTLFEQGLGPVIADHLRGVRCMIENGIMPGAYGRQYVLRRLLRRIIRMTNDNLDLGDIISQERVLYENVIKFGRKMLKRHGEKSDEFWWKTFGILPEERMILS